MQGNISHPHIPLKRHGLPLIDCVYLFYRPGVGRHFYDHPFVGKYCVDPLA